MILFSIIRVLSVLLAIVGTSFLLPIGVAVFYKEYFVLPSFVIPMLISWIVAFVFTIFGKNKKATLSTKSSFVIVALSWISASFFGAVPLYASGCIPHFADAVFESVSGFTTTGATILGQIETLPRSINLWRCQTHWLGGMGIVALTVALLPILGVGGFQLIKAETTGPEKGKFTPKIANTAKTLWFIYIGFTVIQTILLCVAGLDFVDSISITFATLGTGGFAAKNASIAAYNSAAVDWICTVFMFLAGINFSMYFYLLSRKFDEVKHNSELKAYCIIVAVATLLVTVFELGTYGGFFKSLRYAAFQVVSIITTTGFITADYTFWKPASQVIIFILFFIGGCSGSTGGSIKVVRWVILSKQLNNEIKKMIHPQGVFSIRLDGRAGRKDIVFNVTAFMFLYFVILGLTTIFASLFGIDLLTSFTGALSMLGNVGPAFGTLGPSCNYGFLPDAVKWWYCFAMLAGRLELYTMIIFLLPSYWKK
ncbi:MAG: TrkH family potassium uptake protein [Treponema sp.]